MSAYPAQSMNGWISKLQSEAPGSNFAPKVHCFLPERRQLGFAGRVNSLANKGSVAEYPESVGRKPEA